MTHAGDWTPDEETVERANLTRFMGWLAETGRGDFGGDYEKLLARSLEDIAWFWDAVWHFYDIRATTPPETVLASREMPGAQWFPGATLNYAVEAFRHETDAYPALVAAGEDGATEWSWARLREETAAFANYLRRLGVQPGDRVVGYIGNIGEAVAAFLGAASVGATWSMASRGTFRPGNGSQEMNETSGIRTRPGASRAIPSAPRTNPSPCRLAKSRSRPAASSRSQLSDGMYRATCCCAQSMPSTSPSLV